MQQVDQIISAPWICPIAPQNTVLENHSLAIRDGRIVALMPQDAMQQHFQATKTITLKNHVLLPGLVNAHAHTPMNLFRGLADDLALMDWLQNHIWPAEQAIINSESVADGTHLAIAEMLRGGVTCFNDHYFFPDAIAKTAIATGMRAAIGFVIMSVPTQWASDEAGYFARAKETLANNPKHPLITWTVAPHAPYTVSDDSLKQVKQLADEYNLQIHMHVHETEFEVTESVEKYGKRPLQRLHKLGLLSPKFINVHMVHLTDAEIKLIKETGSHVVHCPESNLKLASGFAPISKLQNAGVNVALGTDGAASNNDLDLMGEMRTAALLAKAVSGNPTSLPAHEALKMATLNGAKALGLDHEIGSLELGKAADFIAVDLGSYLTQPIFNPMSHLVYAANRLQVSDVWIAGKQLLQDGRFTQMDIDAIVTKAQKWQKLALPFRSKGSEMIAAQI